MGQQRKSGRSRQWECPTCRTTLVAPVAGARRSGRTWTTAVAAVLLTALTLASGQAAIQAFDGPERATAAPAERQREALGLDIDARHLGGHEIEISATVRDKSGNPVSGGAVLAYLDMASMPGAHTQGPIPLGPVNGESGVYAARARAEMVGEYVVRVAVVSPEAATGEVRIDVGAGIPQPARYADTAA